MALDGAFLRHIKKEIEDQAILARVDKIYQPNRDELVLFLRTRREMFRLLMSARANSPRVHFTQYVPENPKTPPMLCMLLRKRLSGAKLLAIRQPELERLLYFDFESINELGDKVLLTLVIEIMGKYSNIILVDENQVIVDALKRVDAEMSSQRLVLPGLTYRLPPPQHKCNLLTASTEEIMEELKSEPGDRPLHKVILGHIQGLSPVVCRELEHLTGRGRDLTIHGLTEEEQGRLRFFLDRLKQQVVQVSGTPYLVTDRQGKPMAFSFENISQYGSAAVVSRPDSFSSLLDQFYVERDRIERMRARSQDLLKLLTNLSERLSRKINVQKAELEQCANRDQLRIYGDLLNANLYRMERGAGSIELENFYDDMKPITIRLNPALSPTQNAQKYYKEYRKAHTAEQMLTEQIQQAQQELEYIDTVFDALSRASTERELNEIRQELMEQGYMKRGKGKQKPQAMMGPIVFTSSEGFPILVGRNNRQNDKLTLKQANNNDLWFHTKNIPGSHTILVTQGRTPGEETIREAAMLAAYHSRAKSSSQVPVDYTQVRYVNKPSGAKPGMVIYENYHTLYVTPEESLVSQLSGQETEKT